MELTCWIRFFCEAGCARAVLVGMHQQQQAQDDQHPNSRPEMDHLRLYRFRSRDRRGPRVPTLGLNARHPNAP